MIICHSHHVTAAAEAHDDDAWGNLSWRHHHHCVRESCRPVACRCCCQLHQPLHPHHTSPLPSNQRQQTLSPVFSFFLTTRREDRLMYLSRPGWPHHLHGLLWPWPLTSNRVAGAYTADTANAVPLFRLVRHTMHFAVSLFSPSNIHCQSLLALLAEQHWAKNIYKMIRFTSNKSNFYLHQQRSVAVKYGKNASQGLANIPFSFINITQEVLEISLWSNEPTNAADWTERP